MLTVDPTLQAYRTDRLSGAQRTCPKDTGDIICDEVGYTAWFTLGPPGADAAAQTGGDSGGNGLLYVIIGVLVVAAGLIIFLIVRRRRASREALEV